MLRLALAAILSISTLLGVAVWRASSQILRPPWYEHRTPVQGLRPLAGDPFGLRVWQGAIHDPRTDLGLDYADVSFSAVDGSTLRGWLVPGVPGARVAVVTVHGGGGDRREFLRQVPVLHAAGYLVLLFDCREHGVSDGSGRGISLGLREHEDVSSSVTFVRTQPGIERVAVIGTSQGAASALLAAAGDRGIDAVVAESAFTGIAELLRDFRGTPRSVPAALIAGVAAVARWRMGATDAPGPIDVIARIAPTPILLMHGSADRTVPAAHSEALFAAAREPKELWLAPGSDHSQIFNDQPEAWRSHVLAFLQRTVGAP